MAGSSLSEEFYDPKIANTLEKEMINL